MNKETETTIHIVARIGDKREVVEWRTIGFASTAVADPVSSCRDWSFILFMLSFRIVAPDALFT
jgi:hypothetical protein